MIYREGQSIGYSQPGEDATGKPHSFRLYSIASSSAGDDGQGSTVSLCVKRVISVLPETNEPFRGVCSNFLCDLTAGDTARLTGPVGKAFLMPESPDANLIMVATGKGIAPFRAFLRRRYQDTKPQAGVHSHPPIRAIVVVLRDSDPFRMPSMPTRWRRWRPIV